MWQLLERLGTGTRELILSGASSLIQDYVPGLVATLLLICLVLTWLAYWRQYNRQTKMLKWMQNILAAYDTPQAFTAAIPEIDHQINEKKDQKDYKTLIAAWKEYKETLILFGDAEQRHYRNAARPSTFFNTEDLNYGAGFWRIVPGLFVTIGLFLTFVGLVAALSVMNVGGADSTELQRSLDNLLKTASAKFIMSLTGLLCSIIFTIVLRVGLGKVENCIHDLCSHVESLLKFISLEDIAVEQLNATKEQREHFRAIGTELVAELGRPLREELPLTISKSISEAIAPMVERITQVGTEGVGSMVQDLSSKFSKDVGSALANASDSIELAGRKIGELAARMDQSSGNMNDQLITSIAALTSTITDIRKNTEESAAKTGEVFKEGAEKLLTVMSNTLQDIRDNTGRGAEAIRDAAAEMRSAAATFQEELSNATKAGAKQVEGEMAKSAGTASDAITEASGKVLNSFGEAAQQIKNLSLDMSEKLSGDLLKPLDDIGDKLSIMNRELSNGTSEFRRLTEGVKTGADATVIAANTFKIVSQDLTTAASPMRLSVERIDTAISKLESSTTRTAENMRSGALLTVQSAESALKSASEILNGKQRAIEAALEGVKQVVERMNGQGARLDDLDKKLGDAFDKYNKHVNTALEMMLDHTRKMQEELTPALDVMREVVEQAERFVPQTRGSRNA